MRETRISPFLMNHRVYTLDATAAPDGESCPTVAAAGRANLLVKSGRDNTVGLGSGPDADPRRRLRIRLRSGRSQWVWGRTRAARGVVHIRGTRLGFFIRGEHVSCLHRTLVASCRRAEIESFARRSPVAATLETHRRRENVHASFATCPFALLATCGSRRREGRPLCPGTEFT